MTPDNDNDDADDDSADMPDAADAYEADDAPETLSPQTPQPQPSPPPVSTAQKIFRATKWVIFGAVCGLAGVAAAELTRPDSRELLRPGFLKAWWHVGKAMRLVSARYYEADDASPEKISSDALAGIARRLDKYSRYLPPSEYEAFTRRTNQTYTGIGALLRMLDGRPTILRVFAGGGAEECGLKAGDVILEAGGQPLKSVTREEIEERIGGKEGTRARLLVLRPGAATPTEFLVPRRSVGLPSVSAKKLLDDGETAYLRIDNFESRTVAETETALRELARAGAKAVILDLRNNPGGLVSAAVGTVGLFCPKGTVVVTARGRHDNESREYATTAEPVTALPLAVLVNRDSASASEIVSGALQDLRRGVIVGVRTFGKGVVQSIVPLGKNAEGREDAFQLTTARYVLPSGRSIQDLGVRPDVWQPASAEEIALTDLADALQETGRDGELTRRFGLAPPTDPQLETARETLRLLRTNARAVAP
ncbi:MAG: S41 family peptidase [Puniceicoccales bacterium]|jgi:carboxyl-terminal processing protease|nr:S41 family peptidase [Puniceicoccales bacterium]